MLTNEWKIITFFDVDHNRLGPSWQLRDNEPTYWAVLPPSITSSDPVMKDDSSEAR